MEQIYRKTIRLRPTTVLIFALFCLQTPLSFADRGIEVKEAWTRASIPGATNGAVYLTVVNRRQDEDILLSVMSAMSEAAQLHTHTHEEDVIKMRKLESLPVSQGEPVVFEPGGLHIMLVGLRQPLVADKTFEVKLQFKNAGEVSTTVTVKPFP